MRLVIDLVTVVVVAFTTVVAAWLVVNGLRPRTLRLLLVVVGTTALAGVGQWVAPPAPAAAQVVPGVGVPLPSSIPAPTSVVRPSPSRAGADGSASRSASRTASAEAGSVGAPESGAGSLPSGGARRAGSTTPTPTPTPDP
jgi:hypothetical protein